MSKPPKAPWLPSPAVELISSVEASYLDSDPDQIESAINGLIEENRDIHERQCVNLNPATNVMNPHAEAVLARGLGSRPSLGYPGDKYETGLEAIEQIEIIANALVREVFGSRYAECRVASGAMANLYAFMATSRSGDRIIVPPATVGGHVTHHPDGAAGLYGLEVHEAVVDPAGYTVDLDALRRQARRLQPSLITIGGSLNLFPHPVAEIRRIADEVGARVLFDAAHLSGMIAGDAWPHPLRDGAHLMSMSTYKSLGGPPSGLIVTDDEELAGCIDRIAFPGLTANFDVAKSAALAIGLLDWRVHGRAYARKMAETAGSLAESLAALGVPVFAANKGFTQSHQLAVVAGELGGGQAVSKQLRRANLLACGIGLPCASVEGDLNGLRLGTPEVVRWGMGPGDMPELAGYMSRMLVDGETPESLAPRVTGFRGRFRALHFLRNTGVNS